MTDELSDVCGTEVVKVRDKAKIPYELLCIECLTELNFTGHDTGEFMVFICPLCKKLIGVKKLEDKEGT